MENTDNAWVFDSLVGFLHGPIWNMPLQSFIEEKSLPFEPSDDGEVIDRPEYKQVHQEYRDLVDVMLGSFMEDIGITVEQFEAACVMSVNDLAGLPAQFHRRLFDQIWAANDYSIFVKMMTHKNVELQLQALELMGRKLGSVPSILTTDNAYADNAEDDWVANDEIMKELHNLQLNESNENTVDIEPEGMKAHKESLLTKMQSFEKLEKPSLPQIETPKMGPSESEIPKKNEVTEEEMRARQEYLNSQRDKLLALKKQVREKKLDEAGDDNGKELNPSKKSRPPSARAAAAALAGAAPSPTPSAMQLRRALASKLKAEVVDTKR